MIKAWSYSRLVDYEQCPHRAYLKYVERIPEPERPLPPGKTEHANDRGTRVHNNAERYVRGEEGLVPELEGFRLEFEKLRALHAQGRVSLEGEWAFDIKWAATEWQAENAWLRVKLDAAVYLSPTHVAVIDYKTGRRHGNEVKHGEQVQLYQLAKFMRDPEVEQVDVELWYTDIDHLERTTFRREQGLRCFQGFNTRGLSMTTAVTFPARPSSFTCRWCPYNDGVNCTQGVRKK